MNTPERRKTLIPIGDQEICVSSVRGHHEFDFECAMPALDETCVFFPNGTSDVRGAFDDHDVIVEELRHC